MKLSKCLFSQHTIEYLGHIIFSNGVAPEEQKIDAIISWPVPSSIKQLWGFLGLTGFYRHFTKNYSSIRQLAFEDSKKPMTQALVSKLPDFTKQFTIQPGAAGTSMRAVLTQNGHPLSNF